MSKEQISTVKEQLALEYNVFSTHNEQHYRNKLLEILSGDLDFHNKSSIYASHNYHAFPAKFPPQIPFNFITGLTQPGEVVLDPMLGSGTTILEAYMSGRKGIGFDIDPLAIMISRVKTTPLSQEKLITIKTELIGNARKRIREESNLLDQMLSSRWDKKTKEFVDYWYAREVQKELLALILEIEKLKSESIRTFFKLAFSATIVTKSGGVSFALDLAHTRPHKAKVVLSRSGDILYGKEFKESKPSRLRYQTKSLRSPLEEFEKRCSQNIKAMDFGNTSFISPEIQFGNAQELPLDDSTVDLIVTSPPYASNAIDYMRAHKFALVWFGHKIDQLTLKRKEYIGGEGKTNFSFEKLPHFTMQIVEQIGHLDSGRGKVLHRYYSEMKRTLQEMFRVLKPGKSAIVVVGSSVMRGRDTETQNCLADIGKEIGFDIPKIGVRKIDRNKRMLPAGNVTDSNSQIQQRMHEEYVIGFFKP